MNDLNNNMINQVKKPRGNNLIYLAEDDELLAVEYMARLEQAGYRVRYFSELSEFETTYGKESPVAIIMDIVFMDGDESGMEFVIRLKEKEKNFPPVIFVSGCTDMENRLAAARAGAYRYFCKPLDMKKLVRSLDTLIKRKVVEPYRILLVDDDEDLLQYHSVLLKKAGMKVEATSKPLEVLSIMGDFEPDVVVLDVYMPECSGMELAHVIRQDDAWALTSLVFLSMDSDMDRQQEAMSCGGDEYLLKTMEAGHLVNAISAKAKRARLTAQLNKDMENVLRENEFQRITTDQHDIVSTADISGRITSINDKFCEISGYSPKELVGQNHRILKSGNHPDSYYQEMWETISQGNVWHGTICNRNKSGDLYWVKSTIVPFLDEKGRPYKYVSARTDITENKRVEARLKESEEQNRLLLESVGEGIYGLDTEGKTTFVNPAFCEILGYTAEEIIGQPMHALIHHTYPDGSPYPNEQCPTAAALTDGKVYKVDDEIFWLKDGSNIPVEITSTPVLKNNEIVGAVVTFRNIAERQKAQQSLFKAKEEAENANHAKSQFLSSMSHELRTPMNAIMGFGQLLKMETDRPLDEVQQDNVNEIINAGHHLLNLINEVLDLARIESGHIDLSIETVLLGEVLSASMQLIMPLAMKRGIEISLTLNGADITVEQLYFKSVAVQADNTRLRQVLLNLLSNAVKYNLENGKIIIACTYIDNSVDNNQIRISVTDTGAGLNQEQQSQLFKAFNRLGADQTGIEGTGIGLVITKNIVELMGGHIGIYSTPGEGSTFWIELPSDTVQLEQTSEVKEMEPTKQQSGNKSEHEHTVLYIEDNPANLRLVTQLLGRLPGVYVWSAPEPYLGLELAAEHEPDLILLDINLPGMDGYEVLKLLRERGATRNTPVIAISANAMPKDVERGIKVGFDDYITKPIDVNVLLHSVNMKLAGAN